MRPRTRGIGVDGLAALVLTAFRQAFEAGEWDVAEHLMCALEVLSEKTEVAASVLTRLDEAQLMIADSVHFSNRHS